mmetsp:Transcript_89321/g.252714  ORF Transcript_89321/g.252714 Transcript_89321/m.252714 type:complete len:508 (-) Transcript_89321:764-2287(-)
MRAPGVHILRCVGPDGGAHRRGHGLVDEDEVHHGCWNCGQILCDQPHGPVLDAEANHGRQRGAERWGDKPLHRQRGPERAQVVEGLGGERHEHEQQHVQLGAVVHEDVVHVPGHRGEVEGDGLHDGGPAAQAAQVASAHEPHAAGGDLPEEARAGTELHLAPLLPLKDVGVQGPLVAGVDVEAGEDVLGQVDVRRGLGHGAAVRGPEAVHEVWVAVVHAHVEEAQQPLHQGAERPLGVGHDGAHQPVRPREDVLSEADDPGSQGQPVLGAASRGLRVEALENHGHLERLSRVAAHVGVHHLQEVALGEAQRAQLVPRLALREVALGADQQPAGPREHVDHLDRPVVLLALVPSADAEVAVLDQDAGVLEHHALVLAAAPYVLVNQLLEARMCLPALEIDSHEERVAFMLAQHVMQILVALVRLHLLTHHLSAVRRATHQRHPLVLQDATDRVESPADEVLEIGCSATGRARATHGANPAQPHLALRDLVQAPGGLDGRDERVLQRAA